MAITGIFNFYARVFRFSCELTNAAFQSVRSMVRLYDYRLTPIRTEEKLQFEKLKCTLNESSDRITDQVLSEMITSALSDYWLDHAINVANSAVVDAQIRNSSDILSTSYKRRILDAMVIEGIQYLRNLNINSFDVSPSSIGPIKENTLEAQFDYQLYNIKIYNLFNYSDFETKYVTNDEANSMKVVLSSTIFYPTENSAILAITSKQDPGDVMTFFVNHIEVTSAFEVKMINKVRKLKLMNVNVKIGENDQRHVMFVIQILKKYLSMELSKEFQRALTFLMSKIDFYSLNGL